MNRTIEPARHIRGSVQPPPDKSISQRSVLFAALHKGTSIIHNFSQAADPQSTLQCIRQLGVRIEQDGERLQVEGVGRDGLKKPETDVDCGNSGTAMRLLTGLIGGAGIHARLVGDDSLSSRPMRRIIEPLERMGVTIKGREQNYAPLEISRNGKLVPITFELPIPSAQLKSCILLAGLFGQEPTAVIETVQSRDHTERLLQLGVTEEYNRRIITSSRSAKIPEQSYRIPGDFSAAAFWLIAGAVHSDAEIMIKNVGLNPTRTAALDILQEMRADLTVENERSEGAEPVADITVRNSILKPVNISREQVPNCIDELPVLAIAMLFADGISRISGAEELRHKETDRLSAVAGILEKAGARFIEFNDGLEIHGNPGFIPHSEVFESHHDHRVAMTAAILSLMGDKNSQIRNAECAAISYPEFWDHLANLTN